MQSHGYDLATGEVVPIRVTDGAQHIRFNEAVRQLWIAGDPFSFIALAASGVQDLLSIDASEFDWANTFLHVRLTGSGTGKITVKGSHELYEMSPVSLGDRITGMVVGTSDYFLKFSDTNLQWFPYLHFIATETGGVSAINIQARVIGRLWGV